MLLKDRAQGVMMGLALGDALGVITEGLSAGDICSRLGFIKDFNISAIIDKLIKEADDESSISALKQFIRQLPLPGLYSDDTQQALVLADCLLQKNKIDPGYIASAYLEMALYPRDNTFGLFRGAGPGFKTAVSNLQQGRPYHECGVISAGNGAAMRIAPLGIYFHHDYDDLLQAIIDASLLTHRDIRGIAAAGLIAFTIAYTINHNLSAIDNEPFLTELKIFIRSLEKRLTLDYPLVVWEDFTVDQISKSVESLRHLLDNSYDEAVNKLDTQAAALSNDPECKHNHPFAPGSVIFSLYLFIKLGHDPVKTLLTAVNGGGDTDTIAAMAGALCGALHGPHLFPRDWQDQLVNREQIYLRSQGLAGANYNPALIEDLFALEKKACQAMDDYRLQYQKIWQEKLGF